jgi:hypothetical protein
MERMPVVWLTWMSVTESPMRTHWLAGQRRKGTLDRGRVGLHQLGMTGDAGYDGLDQVVKVVALQERLDSLLSVVADND